MSIEWNGIELENETIAMYLVLGSLWTEGFQN